LGKTLDILSLTAYILSIERRRVNVLVYSPDNRTRARLSETDDGVRVEFFIFRNLADQRGLNISDLDAGDLPASCVWQRVETAVLDHAFHIVRDHVAKVLSHIKAD
jgi:hypothetical protein